MSETDYFENTKQLDRKCPLCGGTRTRFGESYSDGDQWIEHSVSRQQCKHCGLGCKHWDHIDALREACEAAYEFLLVFNNSIRYLDQKYYEQTMNTLAAARLAADTGEPCGVEEQPKHVQ